MRLFASALLLLLVAQPGQAHWQFTRWGMSPQEVAKASGGTAPVVPPQVSRAGTVSKVGPYASGDHNFTTKYGYDDNRLTAVTLEVAGPCGSLSDDLKTLYGKPVDEFSIPSLSKITKWIDTKKNNNVMLMDFRRSCTLIYTEAKAENRKGL